MKNSLRVCGALACLVGTSAFSSSDFRSKVIYGDDNRLDLYDVTRQSDLLLADSTVALMESRHLVPKGATFDIQAPSFTEYFDVCAEERFATQPTAAFCSGSLVGPDLILTAGHCINSGDCADTRFVFGFGLKNSADLGNSVSSADVYSCQSVIVSRETSGADFAVVKLDRAVVGHRPLEINRGQKIAPNTEIGVIGHPSGLPTKVAFGSKVRHGATGYFVANLDTYGGNSGSAVFNEATGVIEGVLVRGEEDFVYKNGCRVSNVCESDACRGEDVTYAQEAASFIPPLQ